jgi:hypothetical protein
MCHRVDCGGQGAKRWRSRASPENGVPKLELGNEGVKNHRVDSNISSSPSNNACLLLNFMVLRITALIAVQHNKSTQFAVSTSSGLVP